MQARMKLGANSPGNMKVEAVNTVVEEMERMGWNAHFEVAYDRTELIFTREIETKEMKNQ